jgi:septum formation protein
MILNDFPIVLASGSRYRRELLMRLGLSFDTWSPEVDERALAGEMPSQTAARLARMKTEAGARKFPQAYVVGSDQVADLDGHPIGKPGTFEKARQQLLSMRGKTVLFHTAVCLIHQERNRRAERLVTTQVEFRTYSEDEIERYLEQEPALDCAGSAKSEGLGIALLERLAGDDPTALVGLPLIALAQMLRAEGFKVP